jgi:hypothetical protein
MNAHPNSGAGSIAFDGSNDKDLVEVKDARKSFSLQSHYIARLWQTAVRRRLRPVMVVYFSDIDITAEITFKKGKH